MARKKKSSNEQATADNVEKPKDEKDLYQVLAVDRNASQDEIRKAYHKLALRLHPDKNPGDETAKAKFQSLQSVIEILGDPEKRKVYDEYGSVEDVELAGDTFQNMYKFFRTLCKQISEEDIEKYAALYRGSKEEEKDLKELYSKRKGDMNKVFNELVCSIPKTDSHRFMDIIDAAISAGEVKEFKIYRKWATVVAKEPAPLNPLATPPKKGKNGESSSSSLTSLIRSNGKNRMDALASAMEAKWAGVDNKKRKDQKSKFIEPSEEEFLAAQERVLKKKTKRKGSKQD